MDELKSGALVSIEGKSGSRMYMHPTTGVRIFCTCGEAIPESAGLHTCRKCGNRWQRGSNWVERLPAP